MDLTKAERRELWSRIPWVRRLKVQVPCEGIRWSEVPLKAIYNHGPKQTLPPTGLDPYRCKLKARWHFTALKKSYAKNGNYCTVHLFSLGVYHDMDEEHRIEQWYAKNGERIIAEIRGEVMSGTR